MLCVRSGLNLYIIRFMDRDAEDEVLRDYVRTMINNGYDALELEAFAKKFSNMDYTRALARLGCNIVEDIVLLKLEGDDGDDYDEFF